MPLLPKRIREALLQVAMQPRNLAKSLSQRMTGAVPQGRTVMALDGQWLKLVQVEGPSAERRITKLLACPVKGAGAEELCRTLLEACATEGIAPHDILIVNPTPLCAVRIFSLPSTDPKEIRDIVELQAEKHTPYAKDEILTDFAILERDRSGYSRVLLVIAHQDVVHRPVQLVEAAGFALDRVGCELEGLLHWIRVSQGTQKASGAPERSLVLDVDGSASTLLLMQHGHPQFYRSLATGLEHLLADPAAAGERFIGELQRALETAEAEGEPLKLREILLTGRVERLEPLKVSIESATALPVRLVSPWEACGLSETARLASERLPDVSFAGLVGCALAPGQIDLTPQATKLRLAFEERAKALVVLGCQLVAALILSSLFVIGRAHEEQRYYEKLRVVYHHSVEQTREVEAALRQLSFLTGQMRAHGQLLEAVDTLATHSAPGLVWRSLTFTRGEGVVLKGTSEQLPNIYEFVSALDDSPLFGQVEARRVSKRTDGERNVTDFELVCPLFTSELVPR